MKQILQNIKELRESQRTYFKEFAEEITVRNLQLMKTICGAGISIFCLYYAITEIFFPAWGLDWPYLIFLPITIFFLVVIHKNFNARTMSLKAANCIILMIYGFFLMAAISLSVFPNPDVPSIYYHLFILACPVFFIMPIYIHMIFLIVSYGVFLLLVLTFKTSSVWSHELFESFTAFLFSFILMILMSQFQLQSDSLKSQYYKMSQLDGLTQLLNKVSGVRAGNQYLAQRKEKEYFAALFIDLDNYKHINDTYGHLLGDELLRRVAETLRLSCRDTDIISRFGGDEFLIVLKNIQSEKIVISRVEAIKEKISGISLPPIGTVTCSIGVFYMEAMENMNMESVLATADEALYQAKQKGKNCYVVVSKTN